MRLELMRSIQSPPLPFTTHVNVSALSAVRVSVVIAAVGVPVVRAAARVQDLHCTTTTNRGAAEGINRLRSAVGARGSGASLMPRLTHSPSEATMNMILPSTGSAEGWGCAEIPLAAATSCAKHQLRLTGLDNAADGLVHENARDAPDEEHRDEGPERFNAVESKRVRLRWGPLGEPHREEGYAECRDV